MRHNTSFLLSDHFEKFISNEISSGRYNSADEVIRSALRLLEAEESKKKLINEALHKGEMSGFEEGFDPKARLKKLNATIL